MSAAEAPRCPTCRGEVPPEARTRPFCCERCRRVDLGAWLLGHYRIPAVDRPGDALLAEAPPPPDDRDPR